MSGIISASVFLTRFVPYESKRIDNGPRKH